MRARSSVRRLASARPVAARSSRSAKSLGGSSSGRTTDSDSVNLGSNPSPPAKNRRARASGPFVLASCSAMRIYPLLRPLMFALPTETAHALALAALDRTHSLGLIRAPAPDPLASVSLMGLHFPNRVGLAAGFDKNARYIDALGALGFGFIEVGTVTPRPQPGQ